MLVPPRKRCCAIVFNIMVEAGVMAVIIVSFGARGWGGGGRLHAAGRNNDNGGSFEGRSGVLVHLSFGCLLFTSSFCCFDMFQAC